MQRPVSGGAGGVRASVVVLDGDDHVRRAVVRELSRAGHEVLGEASSVRAGTRLLARRPRVALVPPVLADGPAFGLIGDATARGVAVLVAGRDDEEAVLTGLEAGAVGCVDPGRPGLVATSVEMVLLGGAPLAPRIARRLLARRLLGRLDPVLAPPSAGFTVREAEVAELFVRGATYEDVAAALGISINTVRHHVRAMYEKLHVPPRPSSSRASSRADSPSRPSPSLRARPSPC